MLSYVAMGKSEDKGVSGDGRDKNTRPTFDERTYFSARDFAVMFVIYSIFSSYGNEFDFIAGIIKMNFALTPNTTTKIIKVIGMRIYCYFISLVVVW